jgi:hypothetical protein
MLRNAVFSMWRRVEIVETDGSEERVATIIRMERTELYCEEPQTISVDC